jgi:HAD superfamily hydrolase (TIGR01490 family)
VQIKKAVFSDIDKTIIPNGSLNLVVRNFYKKKLIPKRLIISVLYWYSLYKMNWIKDFSKVVTKSSQLLAPLLSSHNIEALNSMLKDWFENEVKMLIYPEIEQRIRSLHEQSYEIFFVTSTIEPIANLFRDYFGFGKVVATELQENNGYYTAYPKGIPCHGKEKMERIIAITKSENLNLNQSYAFSDHISDLYMLRSVGFPVVVNPNPLLKLIAKKNKWEIINPKLS